MNQPSPPIQDTLDLLVGKRAWGLTRTHGSMFFLEIGDPLHRKGGKKVHGQWHFLVLMCHWRVELPGSLLVGSDDSPKWIDDTFSGTELGMVEKINVIPPSHDLLIVFSSGLRLTTFGASATAKDDWTQWNFYCPNDDVWVLDAGGDLLVRNGNVPPPG